jgi:hypothetical protein
MRDHILGAGRALVAFLEQERALRDKTSESKAARPSRAGR